MAVKKFEKYNSIKELEILGKIYKVDFSRDDIPIVIDEAAERVAAAKEKLKRKDYTSMKEFGEASLLAVKKEYDITINAILGENAADTIFAADSSMYLYDEIYSFIIQAYRESKREALSRYSPERVRRE